MGYKIVYDEDVIRTDFALLKGGKVLDVRDNLLILNGNMECLLRNSMKNTPHLAKHYSVLARTNYAIFYRGKAVMKRIWS